MHRKERTILIATGAEAVLVALRFILAYLSGSLGLRANAWHSLADLFVAFVVYLGLVLARRESKRFSGLFAKIEHIVALFVAGFIFYMGLEIFIEALGEGIELRYVPVATIGAFFGVVISYLVARYKLYVGNQTGSPSLIASGYHSKMDMYSSLAVLVGLMGSLFGMGSLDKIAALVVVVFIFFASIEIFFTNVRALVRGESAQISWLEQFKKPGKKVIAVILLLIVSGYLASGVYYLKWNERGVVLRFGKIRKAGIPPGLHYRLPYPFERVDRVEIESVRRIDTGKSLLLTGDENLIDVNIAVHYQVTDPVGYLYSLSAPDQLVLYAARAAIRQVIGERNIDDVLTVAKEEIETETETTLQRALDVASSGVRIVSVQLKDIAPPTDVLEAFRDVASAREDKVTYINEAQGYKNEIVPKARGEAAEKLKTAEAYKIEKIKYALGDAQRFLKKLAEYQKSRDITELRMYLETMEKVLPAVKKFLVDGNLSSEGTDLWFVGEKVNSALIEK